MYGVIAQAGALIAIGVAWRRLQPMGLEADALRPALTGLVYIVLLPALVLSVLWEADLGLDTVRLAVVAAACVLAGELGTGGAFDGGLVAAVFEVHRELVQGRRVHLVVVAAQFDFGAFLD